MADYYTMEYSAFGTLNVLRVWKKGATLFSTITLVFLGRFLSFFSPMETGMNTPQFHVIYLLYSLMTS